MYEFISFFFFLNKQTLDNSIRMEEPILFSIPVWCPFIASFTKKKIRDSLSLFGLPLLRVCPSRTNRGRATQKGKDIRPQTRDLIYPTVTLAGFNLSLDPALPSEKLQFDLREHGESRERKSGRWYVDRRSVVGLLVARPCRFIVIAVSYKGKREARYHG